MDSAKKKALLSAYKNKPMIGGIYAVQCGGNQRMLIKSTKNLEGQKNRVAFALSMNMCPEPAMLAEWNQYGAETFSMVVLDQLEKKESQTERAFSDDIDALLEIWLEKKESTQR